jgi:CRP-like cAMP-binding protein
MDIYECERDTVIFNKGEIATLFFVIISGRVQIITPNPQQDKKN